MDLTDGEADGMHEIDVFYCFLVSNFISSLVVCFNQAKLQSVAAIGRWQMPLCLEVMDKEAIKTATVLWLGQRSQAKGVWNTEG